MDAFESSIVGVESLTSIFGHWPSFHDAEILELHFLRGNVQPDMDEVPSLTLRIHLWRLTKEVDAHGYFISRDHTLATLMFRDVTEFHGGLPTTRMR